MHFHLNHDPPHQLDILFLCSSTTNQNATVTVSRFDKIEANFYFLSSRITNNTAVHPKKKKKKKKKKKERKKKSLPTYPTFLQKVGRGQTEIILNVA